MLRNVLRRAQANCKIMSVVAATLANGGVCPLTNTEIFTAEVVSRVGQETHHAPTLRHRSTLQRLPIKTKLGAGLV